MKNSSPKSLSADCRYTVGQLLAGSIPTVNRQLTNSKPTHIYIGYIFTTRQCGYAEALPGGGGSPMSPVWILKRLVSVFINACNLLSALMSLSQFGRGRLSLVAISFYTLLLLFGSCRLSELPWQGLYAPTWLYGYS